MYKYLAYSYDNDGNESEDIEVLMDGLLNDSHAIDKALEDDSAIIDGETGEPFVYKQNKDTTWSLIAPQERLKQEDDDHLIEMREHLMDKLTPNGNLWDELQELLDIEREITLRETR
jgi:hypothetical protein